MRSDLTELQTFLNLTSNINKIKTFDMKSETAFQTKGCVSKLFYARLGFRYCSVFTAHPFKNSHMNQDKFL